MHDCHTIEQYGDKYDKRYSDLGISISEYEVQKESKVLKKLEDMPNWSMYLSESQKKQIQYKFWSRPAISWKLSCDDKHPRSSVLKAASHESDKEGLNPGLVIGLLAAAFGVGIAVSFVALIMFCGGCAARRNCGKGPLRVMPTICLTIQLVMIVIVTVILWGQKEELADRKKTMENLQFVNGCGDDYMSIPKDFVPEIKQASSKATFAGILGSIQCLLTFLLCMTCGACGKSKDGDDSSDDEKDLHKDDDEERQGLNDFQ